MQLHNVRAKHPGKDKRTRVGRGGKRGTSSGKGTKGQKSRSGRRIRPAIRDLIQRLPKLRGYSNKPHEAGLAVITLSQLEALGKPIVTIAALREARLIRAAVTSVKILANGEIKRAVTVEGIKMSAAAQAAIEKAGGKVQ